MARRRLIGFCVAASAVVGAGLAAGASAPPTPTPTTTTTTTTVAATTTTTVPAPPPSAEQLSTVSVQLLSLVDLPLLTAMTTNPADGAMFFTSQSGEVWRFVNGSGVAPELVLDLTSVVSPYENGSERGLLGIAFNPVDGRLTLYYTDHNIDSHVVSYVLDAQGRPDPASQWEVLFEDQPGLGHKGGGLAFAPDGSMFLALGDGGGSNGRDAQDYSKVLGGVIRIVPKLDGPGYDIPPDNPYVGQEGFRGEIWAKGLRNPWGFCRDAATGDLWIGDVGNSTMEEVDRIPNGVGGLNFGWYYVEGTDVRHGGAPDDIVAPVYAYGRDVGPAVIGGCVYRGTATPALTGAYVFADLSGPVFAIGADNQVVRLPLDADGIVTGFGIAPDGELIILTLAEGAFHLAPA